MPRWRRQLSHATQLRQRRRQGLQGMSTFSHLRFKGFTLVRRTSRSKRKMERKVGSGRKGTIDEEEYLLKSIGKLTARFNEIQCESLKGHAFYYS